MGKKRGGKNRFKKSNSDATEGVCAYADDAVVSDSLGTAGDSEVNEGDFRVVADYLKGIQPELERLLCSTSIAREDKAVKVDDDVALERRLLLTQFMHTIKGCVSCSRQWCSMMSKWVLWLSGGCHFSASKRKQDF